MNFCAAKLKVQICERARERRFGFNLKLSKKNYKSGEALKVALAPYWFPPTQSHLRPVNISVSMEIV